MITGKQSRAARAALGMTVQDLAERTGVGIQTITRFELGRSSTNRVSVEAIQRGLEQAGIEFTNSDAPGVRWREIQA